MTLGKAIRIARGKLTLKELAAKTGYSITYLSDIQRDKTHPSLNALLKICAALGVMPGTILDRVTILTERVNLGNGSVLSERLYLRKPRCKYYTECWPHGTLPTGIPAEDIINSEYRSLSPNGLLPCPECGGSQIKLQTPADETGQVKRVWFRCFDCGIITPDYPAWVPCHWRDTGQLPFESLKLFWNEFARK